MRGADTAGASPLLCRVSLFDVHDAKSIVVSTAKKEITLVLLAI
jgi:hypothetical protein